ncbi:hypothetical protein [Marinitoga lauensis]|uniref:hypothetical protein n=1 Tax=Marinitoga lauensis TaxID=2201189 RepID=UPI0010112851|nr:hypothetical protein [Marinitoga lauensis]
MKNTILKWVKYLILALFLTLAFLYLYLDDLSINFHDFIIFYFMFFLISTVMKFFKLSLKNIFIESFLFMIIIFTFGFILKIPLKDSLYILFFMIFTEGFVYYKMKKNNNI